MADAMDYEHVVRCAFQCGRTDKFGADARFFRGLERASVAYPGGEIDQRELSIKLGEISAHLRSALNAAMETHSSKHVFVEKMGNCLTYLHEPSLHNIEKCIEEAQQAFFEIKVFPK